MEQGGNGSPALLAISPDSPDSASDVDLKPLKRKLHRQLPRKIGPRYTARNWAMGRGGRQGGGKVGEGGRRGEEGGGGRCRELRDASKGKDSVPNQTA